MWISTLFIIPVLVFTYFLYKYVLKPYRGMQFYKKQKIKGAVITPFAPILGAYAMIQKDFKQHGDDLYTVKQSFQLFPDLRFYVSNIMDKVIITIMDPSILKQFFSKQQLYIKQPFFTQNRIRVLGNGLAFAQGEQWRFRKKHISSVFHYQFYQSFIPIMKDILACELQNLKKNDYNVDALRFGSKIAGKAVVKSFFGMDCNQKIRDKDITQWLNGLIIKVGQQQQTLRSFLFGVNILKAGIFKQDRKMNQEIGLYREWVKSQITKKVESDQRSSAIINILKQKQLVNTKEGLSTDQIAEQFMTLFAGGVDTTAHLICMTLYYLSIYKDVQKKLRDQLLSQQVQDPNTVKQVNSSKYLEAVLNQTFRHYSYMNGVFPRVCVEDHFLGDIPVPKGVLVSVGWIQNNFNKKYFGEDVFEFRPERWEKEVELSSEYIYTPFSVGMRRCLGQKFALIQTKIVISSIVKRFYINIKDGYVHKLKLRSLYEPESTIPLKFQELVK